MINDDEIAEACTCPMPRPIDEPWEHEYVEDCRAHALHRRVRERLGAVGATGRAIVGLLELHYRHDAPGPSPSPTGNCGTCGGTGVVYLGRGEDGPVWSDEECGCETPYCGGCREAWPCSSAQVVAEQFDLVFTEEELAAR